VGWSDEGMTALAGKLGESGERDILVPTQLDQMLRCSFLDG
jgi:hypothetical protein